MRNGDRRVTVVKVKKVFKCWLISSTSSMLTREMNKTKGEKVGKRCHLKSAENSSAFSKSGDQGEVELVHTRPGFLVLDFRFSFTFCFRLSQRDRVHTRLGDYHLHLNTTTSISG